MSTVLVIAAHPDDEVLGCGGAMARHVAAGDDVHIVILAEGMTSRDERRDRTVRADDLATLNDSASQAAAALGVTSLNLHDFPDNRMDSVDLLDVVKYVEARIEEHQPDTVYTHHVGDVNVDHRVTHHAVMAACRPQPGHGVRTVLCFEVASSTEWQSPDYNHAFLPSWFVDISEFLPQKQRALEAYTTEMRPWPHSRSVEALTHLARWRGASIGVEAAEAFVLARHMER